MNEILRLKHPEDADPEDPDFVLDGPSCWIEVDNIAVYIVRADEGVIVRLYPNGDEMLDELGSTFAFFQEAADAVEEFEEGVRNA